MVYERYMLFTHNACYPCGGLGDCCESSADLDDLTKYAKKFNDDDVYIFDCVEGKVVWNKEENR